jgi:methanethiol S-methyltransferase
MGMRKLLFLQFAVFGVMVAALGSAAFGLLLWDFQFPGTFKDYSLVNGGMPLNLVLLLLFGLQHSLMARQGFKRVLIRLISLQLERSFYVLITGFILFALVLLWSPMTPPLYDLRGTPAGWLLHGGAVLGAVIVVWSLAAMGGLDLLGIRSVLNILRDQLPSKQAFQTPSIYKVVRHPLYLGLLLLFWFTPAMTHDHLFFAEVMTAYILIGIYFEERDLVETYGETYRNYQARVPMIIPFLRWRKR